MKPFSRKYTWHSSDGYSRCLRGTQRPSSTCSRRRPPVPTFCSRLTLHQHHFSVHRKNRLQEDVCIRGIGLLRFGQQRVYHSLREVGAYRDVLWPSRWNHHGLTGPRRNLQEGLLIIYLFFYYFLRVI